MVKNNYTEFERDEYEQSLEEENDDPVTQRHRKLLTRNRLVHNIDSTLNLENYNSIHFINGNRHWETLTGQLGPKNRRDTETITWNSAITQVRERHGRCDVITGPVSSVTGIARNVSSYEDCFDLFFDNLVLELITAMSNKRIKERIETLRIYKELIFNSFKYTWLRETSKEEIKAVIGLI